MAGRSGGVNIPVAATWNNKALTQADKQIKSFSRGITKSFAGIGAGIGGALAFGAIANSLKDMGAAAAEDQKSVVSLQKAMQNVGVGAANAQVEDFTKSLMLATGTSDELIRNGLQRLITATGDVTKSQALMQTAMDVSAATGRDLEQTTLAISKASTGQFTALTRLGIPLDAGIIKSKDFAAAVDVMNKRFGGQAAAAAATYAGRLKRIDTAVGEAEESIGYSLIKAVDDAANAFGGTDGLAGNIDAAGTSFANFVTGVSVGTTGISSALKAIEDRTNGVVDANKILAASYGLVTLILAPVKMAYDKLSGSGDELNKREAALNAELDKAYEIRHRLDMVGSNNVKGLDYEAAAAGKATEAQKKHAAALDRVKSAFDRLNGKNISVAEARLNMRELKASGPTPTGGKNGKIVTRDDKLRYAIEVARGTNDLGSAIFDKGNGSPAAQARAAAAYAAGRKTILGTGLGAGVARDFLTTPRALTPAANAAASNVSSVVNNFIFNGGINAATPQAAIEIAKKAARLSKLSGRHVNAGLG